MTNNQMIHKELKNIINELDVLIDLDTKHHKQLNDIYTKISILLQKISIEIICEYVEKRWE